MDDFELASGTRISQVEEHLQGAYRNALQGQPPVGGRATRSRGATLTFIQWVLLKGLPGHVEEQTDQQGTPFETRKWSVMDDITSSYVESVESEKVLTKPGWFDLPKIERPVQTNEQVQANYAWIEWCKMLGFSNPTFRIRRIELGMQQILMLFRTMRDKIRMSDLVAPLKIISEVWIEQMPTEIIQGRKIMKGNCDIVAWLVVNYSRTLREAEFNVVKLIKNLLRMRSRRIVRENMNILAHIVSLIPVEIHDGLRFLAHGILDEIKKLVWAHQCSEEDQVLFREPHLVNSLRSYKYEDWLAFNFSFHKTDGSTIRATQDQVLESIPDLQDFKSWREAMQDQTKTVELQKRYDWGRALKRLDLTRGRNLPDYRIEIESLESAMLNEEWQAGALEDSFAFLIVDPSNVTDNSSNNARNSGSDGSLERDPYSGELTLPSTSTESTPDIPTLENLMEPE